MANRLVRIGVDKITWAIQDDAGRVLWSSSEFTRDTGIGATIFEILLKGLIHRACKTHNATPPVFETDVYTWGEIVAKKPAVAASKLNFDDQDTLDQLFQKTSFVEEVEWNDIQIDRDAFETHVYVPESSYLGHTTIVNDHVAEGSGWDCLFIQELLRLYREGKLRLVQ